MRGFTVSTTILVICSVSVSGQNVRELIEQMDDQTKSNFYSVSKYRYWYYDPKIIDEIRDIREINYPEYPTELQQNCVEGEVILKYQLNDNNEIDSITVIHGIHPTLDAEAKKYLSQIGKYIVKLGDESLKTKYYSFGFWTINDSCGTKDIYYNKGVKLFERKSYDLAKVEFIKAIDANYRDNDAWYNLFLTEYKLGDSLKACRTAKQVGWGGENDSVIRRTIDKICPKKRKEVYTLVESMPEYIGGDLELFKYLRKSVDYPKVAKENGVQGLVVVSFIIRPDGSITGLDLIRDIGAGCGESVMEAVARMPKWKAGAQNGLPVSVKYNLPFRFSLN